MTMTASTPRMITPPLKWHGGKHYLALWIVELMPAHVHYVEPFAGGLAVLLARDPQGTSEVVADIDGRLMNFWTVLREPELFADFQRRAEATPFAEPLFDEAADLLDDSDPVLAAWAFFVRCRQSLAGRFNSFAPLSRTRTRRGMNEQASAWLSAVEGLPAVHARLKRVAILNRPALDVIRTEDTPDTLFYCDPPYLPDTRSAPDVYRHEMTEAEHREFLAAVCAARGVVMVSGYASQLYDDALAGWSRREFDLPNNAAGGARKRRTIEVLWINRLDVKHE